MGADQLLGKTFGKYRLVREIGSGTMGTVYEAMHEILGQRAAVKILKTDLANDAAYVKRFEQEGRMIAKLRHSHIVSVYDLGHEGHVHYLVMEYIQGKTLERLLEQKGALDARRALDFTRQVADALDEAHRHKIIHRDIKPANIMVNRMGKIKVMDFGIAKGQETPGNPTVLSAPMGTPRYMSPEQCRGGDLDGRTDIYSLGVVLFEMLTDRSPYPLHVSALTELTNIIINHPFPSPKVAGTEVSESVRRILTKMTAKDRGDRYALARQVAEDVLACMRTKDYVTDEDVSGPREGLAEAVRHRLKKMVGSDSEPQVQGIRSKVPRRRTDREESEELHALRAESKEPMRSGKERRRVLRMRYPAVLRPCNDDGLHTGEPAEDIDGELLDLSTKGAAVHIDFPVEIENHYTVEIVTDSDQCITAEAEVRWLKLTKSLGGCAVGLRFTKVETAQEKLLADFLVRIERDFGM